MNKQIIEELDEELGIKSVKPILVEKYIAGNDKQTELIYLYYVVIDKKESEFVFNDGEVEQVKWYDVHDALVITQK